MESSWVAEHIRRQDRTAVAVAANRDGRTHGCQIQGRVKMGEALSAAGDFPSQLGTQSLAIERHKQQSLFLGKVLFERRLQLCAARQMDESIAFIIGRT